MNIENDSLIELPYNLIDIAMGKEQFVLSFIRFARHQDTFSIKRGGLTGDFEVAYQCEGMDCKFECDITMGNLYTFYIELDNAFDCLAGTDSVAILQNNADKPVHSKMSFEFDKTGHCIVDGCFMNRNNCYKSGITFGMTIDNIFISEILTSLREFFSALEKIQGHNNYY